MNGCTSRPPASSNSTRRRGSADSLFASTQPAEPAPTITKSYDGTVIRDSIDAERVAAARKQSVHDRGLALSNRLQQLFGPSHLLERAIAALQECLQRCDAEHAS